MFVRNRYTCAGDRRVITTKGGCTGGKSDERAINKMMPVVDILDQDSCMNVNGVDVSIHCGEFQIFKRVYITLIFLFRDYSFIFL